MTIFNSIKLSSRLKNVMKVSGGTILGQLISIVSLPVITRIYGAEIMGIWATILAVALIIQAICDWGLNSGIMIEDDENKIKNIYSVITSVSLFTSILAGGIIILYFFFIKNYSLKLSFFYSLLTVIYAFTVKQVNTSYTWLNRKKDYSVLMKNPIINYTVVAIIAIGLGFIGFIDYGYYVAVILGQLFTLLHMRRHLPLVFFNFSLQDYKWVCKKYCDLIKYQLPNNLMIQFNDQIPSLLIGSLFGNEILGYFSVSNKILNMPVSFIGQAIGKVFYQSASELKRKGEKIGDFVARNFQRAIKLAVIPILALYAVGDLAAVVFFGNEYIIAGTILRIVVFKSFFSFIATSMQGLEIVLRKQKYTLITTITQSVVCSVGIIIGYVLNKDIYISIILMVICFIVVQLAYYSKLFTVMSIKMKKYIFEMLVIFVVVIIGSTIIRWGIKECVNIFNINCLSWFTV